MTNLTHSSLPVFFILPLPSLIFLLHFLFTFIFLFFSFLFSSFSSSFFFFTLLLLFFFSSLLTLFHLISSIFYLFSFLFSYPLLLQFLSTVYQVLSVDKSTGLMRVSRKALLKKDDVDDLSPKKPSPVLFNSVRTAF